MKIFITGGAGFLGEHTLNLLDKADWQTCALTQCQPRGNAGLSRIQWIRADLSGVTTAMLRGVDVLIHLAAHGVDPSAATWKDCFQVNVHDSMQLMLCALQAGIRNYIVAGSCFEYGHTGSEYDFIPVDAPLRPGRPYDASKAAFSIAAEALARDKKVKLSILRFFHLFGPGERPDRFWPALKTAAEAGNDFEMTRGEQVRDFTPVEYAAQQVISEITAQMQLPLTAFPRTRNVGTGKAQTLREFAEYWWKKWNAPGVLKIGAVAYRPNEVFRFVPMIDEVVGHEDTITKP
jgi:nucleoside-diphosphate-sugar epimerase